MERDQVGNHMNMSRSGSGILLSSEKGGGREIKMEPEEAIFNENQGNYCGFVFDVRGLGIGKGFSWRRLHLSTELSQKIVKQGVGSPNNGGKEIAWQKNLPKYANQGHVGTSVEELNVPEKDVEQLLVSLILDNRIQGHIDQVNRLLERGDRSKGMKKYAAIEKWNTQLRSLYQTISNRVG